MANNIELDLDVVTSVISETMGKIDSNQSEINSTYVSMISCLTESSGAATSALKEMEMVEKSLAYELWTTLEELAKCIQSASESFVNLDLDMGIIVGQSDNVSGTTFGKKATRREIN